MNINDVIKFPVLTEKTYAQMDRGYYTFKVDGKTNKIEIKKAVEFIWHVKVEKVNLLTVPKKPKKIGKFAGFVPGYKKAVVKLKEGSINFFPEDTSAKSDELVVDKKPLVIEDHVQKSKDVEAKIAAKLKAKKATAAPIAKKTTVKKAPQSKG